jgi:transcriptional antiterminator RfaH
VTEMNWYLVQFKPNAHRIAEKNLVRQGYRVFLPMQKITKRQSSRFVNDERPLFPGYLFVSLSSQSGPWRRVNSTNGVSRLVSFSNTPSPVPSDFVAGLIKRCDDAGFLQADCDLQIGDTVQISQGPFASFLATIDAMDADERVWILLDLLGQKSRIRISKSNLNPL